MSKCGKINSCRNCSIREGAPLDAYCKQTLYNVTYYYSTNTIHPDCPLPDYVDVEKLQKERDDLVKIVEQSAKWFDEYANIHYEKRNHEKCAANIIKRDHCLEALAKIKEGKE